MKMLFSKDNVFFNTVSEKCIFEIKMTDMMSEFKETNPKYADLYYKAFLFFVKENENNELYVDGIRYRILVYDLDKKYRAYVDIRKDMQLDEAMMNNDKVFNDIMNRVNSIYKIMKIALVANE